MSILDASSAASKGRRPAPWPPPDPILRIMAAARAGITRHRKPPRPSLHERHNSMTLFTLNEWHVLSRSAYWPLSERFFHILNAGRPQIEADVVAALSVILRKSSAKSWRPNFRPPSPSSKEGRQVMPTKRAKTLAEQIADQYRTPGKNGAARREHDTGGGDANDDAFRNGDGRHTKRSRADALKRTVRPPEPSRPSRSKPCPSRSAVTSSRAPRPSVAIRFTWRCRPSPLPRP